MLQSRVAEIEDELRIAAGLTVWDSIAAEPDMLPLTDDQRREIRRRSQAHHENQVEHCLSTTF